MDDLRLPDTEEFNGSLYQLPARQDQEVLTELETRSIWANEHHRGVEQALGSALDHAIQAGEHLAVARDAFTDRQIRDGEWGRWLDANFSGSRSTAQRYMRIFRHRDELGAPTSGRLSIDAAEKMLASPKDHKREDDPSQPPIIDQEEGDEEEEVEPTLVKLPTGKEVTVGEALEFYAKEHGKEQAPQPIKIGKKEYTPTQVKKEVQELRKKNKEVEEQRKAIQTALNEQVEAEREALQSRLQNELAEVYARYNIQTSPSIFEVDDEEFEKAKEGMRSEREREAITILQRQTELWLKLRKYEPDEAARAFMNRPAGNHLTQETIQECSEWLGRCLEEIVKLSTPGVRGI